MVAWSAVPTGGRPAEWHTASATSHSWPRQLANDLTLPEGWRGSTADQLWQQRHLLAPQERARFLEVVAERRLESRAALNLPLEHPLPHYAQAAVDRRAVLWCADGAGTAAH